MAYDNMLATSLHISAWNGAKLDVRATTETLVAKRADRDAGRFTKLLVEKNRLAPVMYAHNKARKDFQRLTLPFAHGMGIVSGAMFDEFRTTMVADRAAFDAAADTFADVAYPLALAEASQRLGALYDAAEFPSQAAVRRKFAFKLRIMPISAPAEMKLNAVFGGVEQQLREEYAAQLDEQLAEAQADVWRRVLEPTVKFVEAMQGGGVFKASTVQNMQEMAELAPRMLVQNDPVLQALCDRLRTATFGLTADGLRADEAERATAAANVAQIAADMERRLAWMRPR